MVSSVRFAFVCAIGSALAACASQKIDLPAGTSAYEKMPPVTSAPPPASYRLGVGDTVRLNVFQEPDLSLSDAKIDANGNLTLALIGDVPAVGRTTAELSADIAQRLRRYLVSPQVTIAVSQSVAYRVTVDGEVKKPGIFEIEGDLTLVGALALAEGTSDIADTRQVLIFRTVGGQQFGAKFDIAAIRTGRAEDPKIIPRDIVIVGTSAARSRYKDLLQLSPLLGTVFIGLNNNN